MSLMPQEKLAVSFSEAVLLRLCCDGYICYLEAGHSSNPPAHASLIADIKAIRDRVSGFVDEHAGDLTDSVRT